MKKFKGLIVLMIVLTLAMTCFVACRPNAEEEPGWGTPSNNGGPGAEIPADDPDSENTPGENEPGENTPGENEPGENKPGENKPGVVIDTDLNDNPLMNPAKKANIKAAVSYDIDKTGFSKGTVADLKGKSLTLYTGVDYSMFGYHTKEGKGIDGTTYTAEWQWFKELKKVYGLTVKYVRCAPGNNVIKPFQAMSAGKDCDVITTHVASFPYVCNILAPLDQYANFNNFDNSPGLDPQMTEVTKWKGHPIALGPCLANGALMYNKTFIKNAGIEDPREQFKKGEWNWTNFKKYMVALPDTTKEGKQVVGMYTLSQFWYWACTNGKPCFEIDSDNPNGGIINNFDSPEVKETYIWLESVCDAGGTYWNKSGGSFYGTDKASQSIMGYSNMDWDFVDALADNNGKIDEFDWVPFPKNEKNPNGLNHVEIYGYGIGLARKTNKEGNRTAAMKFAEIWCNRYTEAKFDRFRNRMMWTYDQIVEFYEYGKKYGRMGMGSGVGTLASHANNSSVNFNKSITDASFSTATCMEKLSNYAKQEVANVLKFGVQ